MVRQTADKAGVYYISCFRYNSFYKKDPDAVRALLVPGISFGAVSLFRWAFRAPRPYEVFETTPVIKKNTKGKSFPSRHVFSIFVIGPP